MVDRSTQVFVKIDDFKDITEILNLAHEKLQQAKNVLNKIAELKAQEDAEVEAWQSELAEIERRISGVDRHLAGGRE